MKVTSAVLDYEKKPVTLEIKDPKTNKMIENKTLTWREVIFQSLNVMRENDPMSTEDKMKSYILTKKAFDSAQPDYSLEDKVFILQQIKKNYGPMICGAAEEYFK